ncbi:MAG: glycosyltransferase [Rickettsiales bacterium]|jgi:glycosyltransferase involved in cell wall biosynthesis|nr:glycosyltransferase [Rickettsiales bacterium]
MAKISVIVPVYNVSRWLRACLDSLLGQTLREIEIICVDDKSPDDSLEILREYEKKDPRIKVIAHETNMGVSAARNTGIKNSSAPLIMFCDGDDAYTSKMCEKMLNAVESSGADCAACLAEMIVADDFAGKGRAHCRRFNLSGLVENPGTENILETNVTAWSKIYRRELIEKYGLEFPFGLYYEDSPFWFAYASVCGKIFYIHEDLYLYNRHGGTITSNTAAGSLNRYSDLIRGAGWLYEFLNSRGLYEKKFDFYWAVFKTLLSWSLGGNNLSEQDMKNAYRVARHIIETAGGAQKTGLSGREIDLIHNERFFGFTRVKKLFGLPAVKITGSVRRIKYKFFGVLVWKIKYSEEKKSHYLLGFIKIRSAKL